MGQTITMLFRKRNRPAVRQSLYHRLEVEQLENRIVPSIALQSEYTGITYANSGYVPPDTQGAAGPTNYVETTNQEIALFSSKSTGASQVSDSLSDFWFTQGKLSRPDSTSSLADPVVVWDEQIQRFIVGDDDIDTGSASGNYVSDFDIAVSKSASPATLTSADWNFFQVTTTEAGYTADYPGNLGWNHDALVFTLNMSPVPTPTPNFHVEVNSIDINALANGTPLQEGVNAFQNDFVPDSSNNFKAFNLRPTVMHDSKAGDPMWLVEENNDNASINVVKMTDVLSSSASFNTTTLAVNSYYSAVPELQPDGTKITTNTDSRIQKAAMQNGLLVAAHTVSDAAGNLDEVQWYAIDTTSGTPVLQQQGDISGGAGTYYAYPGIDINPAGDIGISYMASGTAAGQYMSTYITGRTPSDPAGTMETPVLVQAGQANYHDYANGRAGDLSGISVDSDGSFWIANEYANADSTDNWSTAIAHFTVSTKVRTTANNASAFYSPNAQSVTLSAAVVNSSDFSEVNEGTVTFTVEKGSTIIGTPVQGTVSGGKTSADFSLPAGQAPGSYTIAVSYSDSSGAFSDGGDKNGTLAVAPANVTTTANNASAVYSPNAQTVTLSAGIADASIPSDTVDEGTVTFTVKKGSTIIGTPVQGTVSGGTASADFSLPAGQATGNYTIAVSYSDSTSNFIDGGDTNGTLAVGLANATTTANNASAVYSPNAQTVTLSAAVVDSSDSGDKVNEGTVTFTVKKGSTIIGTPVQGAVSGGTASADFSLPAGQAAGNYTLAVSYSDSSGNFSDGGDNNGTLALAPANVTTTANNATMVLPKDQSVTLHAAVADASISTDTVDEGVVTFTIENGSTIVGTPVQGTVSGGTASADFSLPAGQAPGNYTLAVRYSDSQGNFSDSGDTNGTLSVQEAPAITSGNSAAFSAGQNGSFAVTATGSPTPSLKESGALPGGVTFTDNGNGTATLGGIPALGTQGTYQFSIVAHNGAGSDFTQSFTLTVNAVPPPPAPPPAAPKAPPQPPTLSVPPLVAFFDSLLGAMETINANDTETVTDGLFGIPLVTATYNSSGSFVSATLLGLSVPNWVWYL